MPDPLLHSYELHSQYLSAKEVAEFYSAKLWQEGSFIYLECEDQGHRKLLARIDCRGYPKNLPEPAFVDPSNKEPALDTKFWPTGLGYIGSSSGIGICMAGTRAYAEHHGLTGLHYSMRQLVEILILFCRGKIAELQDITKR
jgi:hypothetical protein